MSDREAKRRRMLELRDSALDLVTAHGRIERSIDFCSHLTRIDCREADRKLVRTNAALRAKRSGYSARHRPT